MALGLGLGTTDQPVPFQDSISVLVALPLVLPTAVHAVAETHDTPSSSLYACAGLGRGPRARETDHSHPWPASTWR